MRKSLKVLIVEDVEDDALLQVAELKRGGFDTTYERVDKSATLRAALERETWDLILCDFTMPYLSGTDALHLVKECRPDVPFIFVSGTIGEDIAIEAMKSGAQDYIMKTNLSRLVPAIRRELQEAQVRRESRLAEAAMRESEHKYRHLFEALSDAVFLADETSGKIIDTNSRAEGLLGCPRGAILGMKLDQFLAPQNDQPGFASLRAATGEQHGGCDLKVLQADGSIVPVHASASKIELYGRTLLLALLRDVTERNRMEEQLRQLSRAVEQSPISVVITDTDGNIRYINSKFMAVTGYTFAEVFGKNPRLLKSGKTPPDLYRELWATIQDGREWRGELQNRKKDGTLYWEAASISPIRDADGVITHFLAVKEDITERKLNQEQIREQAALLDQTQDAVLVLGLDRRLRYVNRSAEHAYGSPASQLLGRDAGTLLFQEEPERCVEICRQTLEGGHWSGEINFTTISGVKRILFSRWTLVHDEDAQPTSFLVVNTDITDHKRLEERFLRAQRMESIGTLASGVAHDLNNILMPIMVAVDLLRPLASKAEDHETLAMVEQAGRRASDIVKQLLTFGRGVEGRRVGVQLRNLLKEIGKVVRETFPKNITQEHHLPDDLWLVEADPTQIHQVLLNLCVNARDAMPGGGHLTFTAENLVIDSAYAAMNPEARPGPYVVVQINDTGGGIPPEILHKIFDPFFTTKEPGKGTGLGLSTVLGIVKSHAGFVQVNSQIGKGTQFKIYLPAVAGTAMLPPAAAGSLPKGGNELILVVDDEEAVRNVARRTLETNGYRVVTAADGAEALVVFSRSREPFQAIMTDMLMPMMDGATLIRALRRLAPSLRLVAMSGLPEMERAAIEAGGTPGAFLLKPFNAETLLRSLHKVLGEPAGG